MQKPYSKRLLVVDDQKDICDMLRAMLAFKGLKCESALTVAEARRLVLEETFDLYVVDMKMPDGSGLEFCREVKDANPSTPVIVYSANGYERHRVDALAAGADAFVKKPGVENLEQEINRLLG